MTRFAQISEQPQSDQLYRQFATDLRRFVAGRVQVSDVDDVVQDIFLRIHRNLSGLRESDRIAGWVFRIARSAIAEHYRRLPAPAVTEVPELADTQVLDEIEAGDPQRLGAWLSATVDRMPEPYREALQLVEREGVSQRAAAAQLGVSVSGMKSRVQRGRAKLRQALERCCAVELDRRGQLVDYRARATNPCCE